MALADGYVGMTLNGNHITVATQAPEETEQEVKSILDLGMGGKREQLAWRAAGFPVRTSKRSWRISWNHLRGASGLVERILAGPGPFTFAFWKPVTCWYVGDGSRREFYLPHELGMAIETLLDAPGGIPLATFEPEVRLGVDGSPLVYYLKSAVDYATGDPSVGDVWFKETAATFKLNAAPDSGDPVIVTYYPLYSVIASPTNSRRLADPIRNPRTLELLEL